MKKPILLLVVGTIVPVIILSAMLFAAGDASTGFAQSSGTVLTPTYVPIPDDFDFSVTRVRGSSDPIVFEDQEVDGFSVSNFTYTTRYPRGLEFSAQIDVPEDVEIVSINVVHRFPANTGSRTRATERDGVWTAIPFDTGGLPPWMSMDVWWRIAYGETGLVETQPVTVQYVDPTREWFRLESKDVIVYWFDMPEEFGEIVANAFVNVRGRYLEAFRDYLSFKPTVLIFPPGDSIAESRVNGQLNPRTTGFANNDTYAAVLRVRGLEIEAIRENCIWNEPRDLEWQMRFSASVATHEVAHLYQYENYGAGGPAWWVEGHATYLELEMGPVEARLRNLVAEGVDLWTFQGTGPSGLVGTPAIDGCTHLGYEQGAHFINYIVTNSPPGTHAAIIDELRTFTPLAEAIENATGRSMLDWERNWRMYLGLDPEPNIIPTPTFSFPAAPTPFGQ